jgi:endoglucanase
MDRTTGRLLPPEDPQKTDYGFDAIRTPWRVAVDWAWNREPRALATLERMSFLSREYRRRGKLLWSYGHDGTPSPEFEGMAMYGASLGYFIAVDPQIARHIYETKLIAQYDRASQSWTKPLSYFDDNWAWFGLALYQHRIVDLGAGLRSMEVLP